MSDSASGSSLNSSDVQAQIDALNALSVAYEEALDFVKEMQQHGLRSLKLQSTNVIKEVLCRIELAKVNLFDSGIGVKRSWIIANPLNTLIKLNEGHLGSFTTKYILEQVASEGVAFEHAIEDITLELGVLYVKSELAKRTQQNSDVNDSQLDDLSKNTKEAKITFEGMKTETQNALTGRSLNIFRFLVERKHKTNYQTLRDNIWRNDVEDASINSARMLCE